MVSTASIAVTVRTYVVFCRVIASQLRHLEQFSEQ